MAIAPDKEPKTLAAFLQLILHLLRYDKIDEASPAKLPEPWYFQLKNVLANLNLVSLSNISDLLIPPYSRFILVRHPFERLASAYHDKMMKLPNVRLWPEPHYDEIRKIICVKYFQFKNVSITSPLKANYCLEYIPPFEMFIRYILDDIQRGEGIFAMDIHWKPFSSLCQVCKFRYNVIGKYETFDQDIKQVMSRLNMSNWILKNRDHESGDTKWRYQHMYSTLSDNMICELRDLYEFDLNLFDYQLENYISRSKLLCPSSSKVREWTRSLI